MFLSSKEFRKIRPSEGKFALPDALNADVIRSHPADRVYAEASIYRGEILITPDAVSDRRT